MCFLLSHCVTTTVSKHTCMRTEVSQKVGKGKLVRIVDAPQREISCVDHLRCLPREQLPRTDIGSHGQVGVVGPVVKMPIVGSCVESTADAYVRTRAIPEDVSGCPTTKEGIK